ncbi:RDD family protein [Planotetraspora mira]|uniref:RDD domain-containing protein n=1 Tax=Planotetraspora mira TaxID=58121 RepID=A0A8J3XC84_9ACTN|nr:RDD family protein [Planotetraspora mira]GII31218.1 hypothetical protein Pmi06nite_46600 [Planotetraspora mira]
MTAEPPPGQNPYESAPPPPPGGYPPPGYGPYGGAPQGAPIPPGAPAPLAEWWERWVARLIDSIMFAVVFYILSGILGLIGGLIAYLGYAAYDYMLHSKDGQTLGKKAMKIQLVGVGGAPLDSSALMKRSAIYPGVMVLSPLAFALSGIVGLFVLVLGILIIVDSPLHQGLHDKIAGTLVVKAPR